MKDNALNGKIVNSLFWKLFERIGTQGIQFIVSIILARILCPSDYGYVSMLLVFTSIANIVIQQGFSTSLIQKKQVDDSDFISGYWLSLIIAAVCYIILFFLAPLIANFYNMPLLCSQLRVISVILFFGGSSSILEAKLRRDFKFKKIFLCSLIAIVFSGSLGILSAYYGLGSWALVIQQVVNYFVVSVCLHIVTKLNFKAKLSLARAKVLFSFGWKILGASLIDAFYREIYNLTIGKVYKSETLGNYNKAEQFPKLIAVNVDGALSSVMLPAFSKKQDDKEKMKQMVKRTLLTSTFLVFPMMLGLAAVSKTAVLVLLTEKWLGCVPYMELLCISYIFYPFYSTNNQAIQASGRSDYCLKIEFIKRIIGIGILILTLPFGVLVMVEGQIVYAIISSFIHAFPNKKLLNYGYFEQVKDVFPNFVIAGIMALIVYLFNFISMNIYIKLFAQMITGALIYFMLSKIFKLESYEYILSLIKDKFNKKSKNKKNKRVMFISSVGGHLTQLLELKSLFNDYNYVLVTDKTDVSVPLKEKYKMSFLVYGSRQYKFTYPFIFIYNIFKSIVLFIKYRPSVIITTGTHTAVPMCYIGWLFRKKVIYIESFAKRTSPTLSGRIVYPIATKFIVQWEEMLKYYPKAEYWGWIY